jgi:hypothetical protein
MTAERKARSSDGLLPPSPPGEKANASKDKAGQASIMFDDFYDLDVTEKAGIGAALNRCRALAAKIANQLRNKRPKHFGDKLSMADIHASLNRHPRKEGGRVGKDLPPCQSVPTPKSPPTCAAGASSSCAARANISDGSERRIGRKLTTAAATSIACTECHRQLMDEVHFLDKST